MMKNLFIIFFLFLCYNVVAQQRFPTGIPNQFSTGWFKQGYQQSDSGTIVANRDTTWKAKYSGTIVFRPGDKKFYYFDSTVLAWFPLASSAIDTTSLSNRINLKLNTADTTNKWWGVGKRWVDTVYRKNDSTIGFTINNGAEQTFQILGRSSSPGSGLTSVGLSMPSAFSVSGSPLTSNGTISVSGAGTSAQHIRGNGTLATTDTGMIPNFYLKVRGLITGTSPITFNQITGAIGIPNANTTGQKGAATFNNSDFTDNGAGLISLRNPSGGSGVDTIFRTPGVDSVFFTINSVQYAIKDSAGSSASYTAGNGIDLTNNVISQLFVPLKAGSIVVGNSFSKGCCPDGTYIPYQDTLSRAFLNNISITNLGQSGNGVRKGAYQLFTNFGEVHANTPILFEIGFNNTRILTDTAVHNATIQAAYKSMVLSQFLIHIEAPNWGASGVNPNVTYSTASAPASSEDTLLNWQSRLYWFRHNSINTGANWFNKASCNNDTITIRNFRGPNIGFGTFAYYNSAGSRIKINVDGVDMVTYDPNNKTYTGQAEGFTPDGIIPDAIVVTGLTDSFHVVKVIFIDNGKRGALDYFGTLCSATESYDRPAYVLAFPHMNATGYAYPGGETTPAILDSASSWLKGALQQTFPGYALSFVNINADGYYNPLDTSQIDQGDGIHPTNAGHYQIARAIYSTMLKSDKSSGTTLDQVLANGNTSARQILLSGSNSSAPNFRVGGDVDIQVFAPSNAWLSSNMSYNGSNFVYTHNGFATQLYMNNNGYIEYKNASSGTAGGVVSVNTRLSLTPNGDAFIAGNITNSADGSGAKLKVDGTSGNVVMPGIMSIGANTYTLTEPIRIANYGGVGGGQPALIFYNAAGGTHLKYSDQTLGTNTIDFRLLNDDFNAANSWMTVTRSSYTAANVYFGLGEVNIGNATDQGAYTLQNTGGLYQNGSFSLQPLAAPPSTYNVLVHGLTDSLVYQIPASALGGGITTLNTLTAATQTFATGASGTDFNISSSTSTHTFNIPSASTVNRGLITTGSQTLGGQKTFNDGLVATSTSNPRITINGNVSISGGPSTYGDGLVVDFFTHTNTDVAGTISANQNFHFIASPTLTSSNAISYTGDVATIRFVGAPIAAGSTTISHPYNILANDVNFFGGISMLLNEQAGDATIANASGVNVYTGAGGNTWTLPSLATHPGKFIFIKNAGGGNLTVQRAGSDNIYDTSSVTSITIAAGVARVFMAGSSFWYVQ